MKQNKAKLVVKYVDENGKDLRPSETTEGKVEMSTLQKESNRRIRISTC